MSERPSSPFLTVGQLREAMEGLPDDAQVVVTASDGHHFDQGITETLHSHLILWEHDCTDSDDDEHRPGRDCPTTLSLELWLNSYDEAEAEASERGSS